jgi:MerR family redox-sensitive transcriptional activator SoxR
MTIGQLSDETGVPASTIRYYERIGVLPQPGRVSGQRRYGSDAVDRLAVLRLAQACGFHLEEMRVLVNGFSAGTKPPARWRKLAEKKTKEIDLQLERLTFMRGLVNRVAGCKCVDLAECARRAASVLGGRK